jgi:hypothetical protein
MHPTADTTALKFLRGVARRVMPGVRFHRLSKGENTMWHKVSVPNDQSEIKAVRDRFMMCLMQTRAPVDCAAFQDVYDRKAERTNIYFSPVAAELCSDIVEDYSGERCDKPDPSRVQSLGGHGNDMEWLRAQPN